MNECKPQINGNTLHTIFDRSGMEMKREFSVWDTAWAGPAGCY